LKVAGRSVALLLATQLAAIAQIAGQPDAEARHETITHPAQTPAGTPDATPRDPDHIAPTASNGDLTP
jgi:glycogen operon protein